MNSISYYCVAYDGAIYCNACCPVDIKDDRVSPVFADQEVESAQVCDKCRVVHDYMNILEGLNESAAHTPGPWRVEKNDASINPQDDSKENYFIRSTLKNGDYFCVATLDDYHYNMRGYYEDIHEANAKLIAAAPDLLKACELAFERFKPRKDVKKYFSEHVAHAALSKAIHKAKGK